MITATVCENVKGDCWVKIWDKNWQPQIVGNKGEGWEEEIWYIEWWITKNCII